MISVVIPVFNEEGSIHQVCAELAQVLGDKNYELVFVDDGSSDRTQQCVEDENKKNPRVKGIYFSRNFGHQNALYAGIAHASGAIIVMMDGDLQHPPKVVPQLIEAIESGYDIANAIRKESGETSESWFKKTTSRGFYNLLNRFSEIPVPHAGADFRAITRSVADAFLSLGESSRFNRGLFAWLGFRQAHIEYEVQERHAGESKYSIKKMLLFALDGLTSFSAFPLRFFFGFGLFLIAIGLLYLGYSVVQFFQGSTVTGWPSIIAVLVILLGSNLFGLGLVGEYVGRIFMEVKRRPLYLTSKKIGFDSDKP